MRGDSLRDLYAKTLALLGLGVLAGAGALVDYWPVGVTMPDAGPAQEPPALARALPISDLPSVAVVRGETRAPRHGVNALEPRVLPAAYASLPVAEPFESGLGQALSLEAPAARPVTTPTLAIVEPAASPAVDGLELHAALPASVPPASMPPQAPAYVMAGDDSDGFISGAFKKTGASIVKTSVKTGASIVDAVRVVGGAVRKALPN